MPAGTSWPSYIGAAVCAMLSMFAGAQTVHMLYKPLQNLDAKVEIEKQRIKEFTSTTENSKENISRS